MDEHHRELETVAQAVRCPRCGSAKVTIELYQIQTVGADVTLNALLLCNDSTCAAAAERTRHAT